MLSKVELEFLKSPERFDGDYSRVLRHRIKAKTAKLHEHSAMLEVTEQSVTENCNGVTEFRNGQQNQRNLNQAAFGERSGPSRIRTGDLWLVKPTS